jgi:hypothetical protein
MVATISKDGGVVATTDLGNHQQASTCHIPSYQVDPKISTNHPFESTTSHTRHEPLSQISFNRRIPPRTRNNGRPILHICDANTQGSNEYFDTERELSAMDQKICP